MTFIASLKAKKGIVQVSDSLELQTGAISRFDDFKKLFDAKGIDEENQNEKLSAKEIWNTFKPERIKNIDGAKKTFQITEFSSIQISGSALINGTEVKDIIKQLTDITSIKRELTDQNIVDELLSILYTYFPDREILEFEDPSQKETFSDTSFIFYYYDKLVNEKHIHTLAYRKNALKQKYTYNDAYEGSKDWIYFSAGMLGLSHNFYSLNHSNLLFRPPTFREGFQIMKSAIELAILTEKINYDIPGVGGTINYSVIDKNGFKFFRDELDLAEE